MMQKLSKLWYIPAFIAEWQSRIKFLLIRIAFSANLRKCFKNNWHTRLFIKCFRNTWICQQISIVWEKVWNKEWKWDSHKWNIWFGSWNLIHTSKYTVVLMKFNEKTEDVFSMLWSMDFIIIQQFLSIEYTERHHSFIIHNCIFYSEIFIIGRCSNTYFLHYIQQQNYSFTWHVCAYVFQDFGSFSAGKMILHGFNKPLR